MCVLHIYIILIYITSLLTEDLNIFLKRENIEIEKYEKNDKENYTVKLFLLLYNQNNILLIKSK